MKGPKSAAARKHGTRVDGRWLNVTVEEHRWACTAVSQHEDFMPFLGTGLSARHMTLQDVDRVPVAIDERMAFYLEEDTG
ncbi:MAG: hypothetical protein CEE40_07220 [Chloroflexi bacterium B3_Chlor]|nr:MAG: hypothetical protein CEE40_07220 [Chloroflexi bacterium B3_Chlor]